MKPEEVFDVFIFPFIIVGTFLLPILQTFILEELRLTTTISPNLRYLLAAITGGVLSTLELVLKRVVDKYKKAKDSELVQKGYEIAIAELNRDIRERDIVLDCAVFNDQWIQENEKIRALQTKVKKIETL